MATEDYAYDPEFEQQLQPNPENLAETGFCSAGGSRSSPAKRRRVQNLNFTPNSVSNYLDWIRIIFIGLVYDFLLIAILLISVIVLQFNFIQFFLLE